VVIPLTINNPSSQGDDMEKFYGFFGEYGIPAIYSPFIFCAAGVFARVVSGG
jgi:hypothetical protein